MDPNAIWTAFVANPGTQAAVRTIALCTAALYAATIYWALQDARIRVAAWWAAAALGLVSAVPFIGLALYILLRPGRTLDEAREAELARRVFDAELARGGRCAHCGAAAEADWRICPLCRAPLAMACPACAKPTRAGWSACPFCTADLSPRELVGDPVLTSLPRIA